MPRYHCEKMIRANSREGVTWTHLVERTFCAPQSRGCSRRRQRRDSGSTGDAERLVLWN